MKTIDQIIDNIPVDENVSKDEIFYSRDAMKECMKEYARQACERQKIICLKNWVDYSSDGCLSDTKDRNYIIDAPLPDLK